MGEGHIKLWGEFLKRYYWDDILKLAGQYPIKESLVVKFDDIERFDFELASELLDSPDLVLVDAHNAISEINLPIEIEDWLPGVRVTGLPHTENILIREVRNCHVDKLISVSGLVQKSTEVRPRLLTGAFKCQRCEHTTIVPQRENTFIEPYTCDNEACGRKGPFILIKSESVFTNSQTIRIQESPEEVRGGTPPQALDVRIEGELVGIALPGNRIVVTGIPRSIQKSTQLGKSPVFDIIIEAVDITIDENEVDVEITPADKLKIEEIASRQNVTDLLIKSFGTSIHGNEAVKEGVLAAAVSGDNTVLPDGTLQRGYSHVLICGDPSVSKSTLLYNINNLVPRSQYSTGDGSSKAGLTASVVRDDFYGSKWCLEAGTLVLADRSLALIDELDKMRIEDVPKLNTALSSSKIPINKAGINCLLWARAPVIAALNPKEGRFNNSDPIIHQVNIRADTLSRFDLVFLMRDIPSEREDPLKSKTLVDAWCNPGKNINETILDTELLKKYIASAKQIKQVSVSSDAQEYIITYYNERRKVYKNQNDTIPITLRNLEALIRLTRAEAKLRLSSIADRNDAVRATKLLETSIREICEDSNGYIDIDNMELGIGKSQRDVIREILTYIRTEQKKGVVDYGDLVLKDAADWHLGKEKLDRNLAELKREGEIFEPDNHKFRAVV